MIKKLLSILSICVYIPVLHAQAPFHTPVKLIWLPPINAAHVPLRITFIPKERKIEMYGLTQSWIGDVTTLHKRATESLLYVTRMITEKISKGTISRPLKGAAYSFVLDNKGDVQAYDPKEAHKNYFLQPLGSITFK